jgi:hypothetical protein
MKFRVIADNAGAVLKWLRNEKGISCRIVVQKTGNVSLTRGTKNIYNVLTGSNVCLVNNGQYIL